MVQKISYCRICQASCGIIANVEDNRIVQIVGDADNPLSQGFTCPKGRRGGELLAGPSRLTQSLKKQPDGSFAPIDPLVAAAEIGARLTEIIGESGAESAGMFRGTQQAFNSLTRSIAAAWWKGVGSHKIFSTMTIDQSAKWVVSGRMGDYMGGRQGFDDADVWMLAGTNPLISVNGGTADGVLMHNPSASLRAARERGLKLIVIDPRRTETAYQADIHLMPVPGHDALIFAGILNIILSEGLHDREFCDRFADGVEALADAVASATPQRVEAVTGIPAGQLLEAARLFAKGPRGMVSTGTGVCMGPDSNVAEHLATCINVVCGRYRREGEPAFGPAVMMPDLPARAEVSPPARSWERGWRSRFGAGVLMGELPSCTLNDEILEPGEDRIRALIVSGANPLLAMPDADRTRRAFASLDLLVAIDTRLSETAQMADYVIAPTMFYERGDHTMTMEYVFPKPYAMATGPIVEPPPGTIDDWRFFFELARVMDIPIRVSGRDLDMDAPPSSETLLQWAAGRGRVPLAEIAAAPHGLLAAPRQAKVEPASDAMKDNRLQLIPEDVAQEIAAALARPGAGDGELRLIVRRMRGIMNTLGREFRDIGDGFNPAHFHPGDMARLDIAEDSQVRLTSRHGSVTAVARADPTLRPGCVSLTHGWGGLDPASAQGVNVNVLTGHDALTQTVNHMPVLTGVPLMVERAA
ncbi:molybdopterin-dependent oxidoreductase [Sphingobium sp. Sx8-8]|uniref:molybdopterin-containing oxidoreductase family protein n=1 Tax=Sphingobium sp. Sx8-8 TaxID=2933617 RepID=UPI001F5AA156|nr:molybdopterin-dependent oxidoreductase [Sphingobium sp. Sx8-8]